jgi:hypothetical protein
MRLLNDKCLYCGTPIQWSGRGRPKQFCGNACACRQQHGVKTMQRDSLSAKLRLLAPALPPGKTIDEVCAIIGTDKSATVYNAARAAGYTFKRKQNPTAWRKSGPRSAGGKIAAALGLCTQTVSGHIKRGAPATVAGYAEWKAEFDAGKEDRRVQATRAYFATAPKMSTEDKASYRRAYRQRPEVKARQNARNRANKDKNRARYRSDVQFRLACCLRSRTRKVLKGLIKSGSTMDMVGCTGAQLKAHLESQFVGRMSWENYGKWEIDHIIPLAKFDLSDPKQQRLAFHYTNLRPLWEKANMEKSAKIVDAQFALQLPPPSANSGASTVREYQLKEAQPFQVRVTA